MAADVSTPESVSGYSLPAALGKLPCLLTATATMELSAQRAGMAPKLARRRSAQSRWHTGPDLLTLGPTPRPEPEALSPEARPARSTLRTSAPASAPAALATGTVSQRSQLAVPVTARDTRLARLLLAPPS